MTYRNSLRDSIGPNFETHTIVSLTRIEEHQHRIEEHQHQHTQMLKDILKSNQKQKNRRYPEWMTPAFLAWVVVALLGLMGNLSADQIKLLLTTLPR